MKMENAFSVAADEHPCTILLVDDSPVNLGVIVESLETHGYDVLVAVDGEEALQRTGIARPDLILLDVMMPGLDGLEVCRRLKMQPHTRDIPVIFMTSLSGIEDKVKGLEAGAVDYVTKPLQIDEVRARVKTHLKLCALQRSLEENVRALEEQAAVLEASRQQHKVTEAWYRGIFRSAPDGMVVVNAQGMIALVNEHLEKMFGYVQGELIGQPVELLLPAGARNGHVAKRTEFFASGVAVRPMDAVLGSLRACRKDGTEFPVDVSLSRLPDADGMGGVVCAAIRDITERKRIQQKLELLDHAINQSSDAMFLLDEQGRFNYVNDTACRKLGYSREELLTMDPSSINPGVTRERVVEDLGELVNGAVKVFETRHHARDGRIFSVEISSSRLEYQGVCFFLSVARDISERKRMEAETRQRDEYQRTLLNNFPYFAWLKDKDSRLLAANSLYAGIANVGSASELEGKTDFDFFPRDLAEKYVEDDRLVMAGGEVKNVEEMYVDQHGERYWMETWKSPVIVNGEVVGTVGCSRDITGRKQMEDALIASEQESRTLIDNSPDTIARYNRHCRRGYVNPAFAALAEGGAATLLGKTPTEYPGGPNADVYEAKIKEVFADGESTEFELKWPDKDGREICSLVRLTAERDTGGNIVSVLAVGRDITELNEHRKRVYQMAFYDSLTSLPNRALFNDRLRQMLTDASWHNQLAGVMLLDLDRFKAVNDTLGHPAGDELLREAAARLTYCVRGYDTVARLGGDEFAILLPEVRSGDDLGRVAGKILEAFNEPFMLEGKEVFITGSIGIALYPEDSLDSDDLLKQADSAMYFAKRSGRNNFRFYSSDLTVSATERLTLEGDLRRGFARDELELYFQPKVNLADGRVLGSEALLRWHHPQRGMVPPDKFISIAEDSGLIVEIGEWVLRSGCLAACEWNRVGMPLHKVAINLSARQFQSNDLVRTVRNVLQQTGCQPEWIELEITESLLLDEDGEVLEVLEVFREMGITIAIDDFGTGYSALSYLARFPIDTLKIDRSFTSRISEEGHHAELVKAIVSIANSLNQTVVAEGVETVEQALFLQLHGCHIAQGYLYSKPIPKEAFELLPQSFAREAAVN